MFNNDFEDLNTVIVSSKGSITAINRNYVTITNIVLPPGKVYILLYYFCADISVPDAIISGILSSDHDNFINDMGQEFIRTTMGGGGGAVGLSLYSTLNEQSDCIVNLRAHGEAGISQSYKYGGSLIAIPLSSYKYDSQ